MRKSQIIPENAVLIAISAKNDLELSQLQF